ncbi:GFA family protein [Thalassotalea atypica]|uniref:GFA family protein n=1 Tax=Thalassotalea atypica TaxID=2054316 RepID=UPI00257409E6|nr:GFA family protein [Thalassotalea atypica]
MKNSGSCLCGDIRFSVQEFEPMIGHCHCKMCQKFHGAAFSTFGEVKLTNLTWLAGEDRLASYCAENGSVRKFCQHCGSSLLFESCFNRETKTVEISLAAFDTLEPVKPDAHIYTDSQVNWCQFNDQLPKFKGYRE